MKYHRSLTTAAVVGLAMFVYMTFSILTAMPASGGEPLPPPTLTAAIPTTLIPRRGWPPAHSTPVDVTTSAADVTHDGLMFVVLGDHTTHEEVSLVAAALPGWIEHVVVPQRTLHIAIFYAADTSNTSLTNIIETSQFDPLNATHVTLPPPNRYPILLIPLPKGAQAQDWERSDINASCCYCGVPAKASRAAIERWLAFDFFHHPVTQRYRFVVRMSPYTRFFRRPRFSLFGEMQRIHALIAPVAPLATDRSTCHSGVVPPSTVSMPPLLNGNTGTLHAGGRITGHDAQFLIMSTVPYRHSAATNSALQRYVTEHAHQFLSNAWTASHLWTLAATTHGSSSVANWAWMLWQPRVLHKNAVLYFSSTTKSIEEIKRWTRLRWSRVAREKTGY